MGKNRKTYSRQACRPQKRSKYIPTSSNNSFRNKGNPPKTERDGTSKISLREDEVGITEFVTKNVGFTAVVKSRFSDFQVNEIDRNGKVLHLNDVTVPSTPVETLTENEIEAARQQFGEIITSDVWAKIDSLSTIKANDPSAKPIDINVTSLDKEKRTQIHNILKHLYKHKLVSSTINHTINSQEERFIRIMKPKGTPGENRKRWLFPGEYVHFLVYKENMDTMDAASRLASSLGLHPSQVNYCGTKDKRAKTTQNFCIKRRLPREILAAAKISNIRVGNFEFSKEVLKLGDLNGNRFRIALRHVNGDEVEIERALENLRDNGFINYFGLQRFGNHSGVPTHEVGVALLKSDYKKVVELILKPRLNDNFLMDAIRKKWWTDRDSSAAAAMFDSNNSIEKKLMDGLAQYGENDYSAAMRKIPRNMLLLYPHAFQSLVFNRIASRRIQTFGLKLIPGDLVYRNREEMDEVIIDEIILKTDNVDCEADETTEENKQAADIDAINEPIGNAADDSMFKRKVKALHAEDIASGYYTLYDVVLPLPGYDITYPNNEVGTWYEEILQEYGLSSEKLRHNVKTFSLGGAYRKLIIRPDDLTWKTRKYSSPEDTLIASDWENITHRCEDIEKSGEEGTLKALLLDFKLPRSVYATMLLRELLKADTSAMHQKQIENNEMKKLKNSTKMKTNENENKVEDVNDNGPAATKRMLESDNSEELENKKSKVDE